MKLIIRWLVPIVYGTHTVEEASRFVHWTKRSPWLFTAHFDTRKFIFGDIVSMTYVLGSVSLALAFPWPWTFMLGLSTAIWIVANFLIHACKRLISGIYFPGMVIAGALSIPTCSSGFWSGTVFICLLFSDERVSDTARAESPF